MLRHNGECVRTLRDPGGGAPRKSLVALHARGTKNRKIKINKNKKVIGPRGNEETAGPLASAAKVKFPVFSLRGHETTAAIQMGRAGPVNGHSST